MFGALHPWRCGASFLDDICTLPPSTSSLPNAFVFLNASYSYSKCIQMTLRPSTTLETSATSFRRNSRGGAPHGSCRSPQMRRVSILAPHITPSRVPNVPHAIFTLNNGRPVVPYCEYWPSADISGYTSCIRTLAAARRLRDLSLTLDLNGHNFVVA